MRLLFVMLPIIPALAAVASMWAMTVYVLADEGSEVATGWAFGAVGVTVLACIFVGVLCADELRYEERVK